jgi:hypothetical protein
VSNDDSGSNWYDRFRPSDFRRVVQRPEPDNWVQRTATPNRHFVTGDLTIEGGDGGGTMTAAEILAALKTVDGAGSGLDADLVRGIDPANFATASALAAEIARAVAAEQALAPLDSPSFTGVPVGPTAEPGTNNTQLATTAFVLANAGEGGGGGTLPVLTPEQYGITQAEPDANASLVVDALQAMFLEAENRGGAICWLRGNYPINEPIYVPSNVSLIGVSRAEGATGPSTIRGIVGNHDLLKFAYGVKNVHISNLNFAHSSSVTPTAGVMIDARWIDNFFWQNISGFNLYNGIDFGVARSGILQDCYLRGFTGTSSGMGTDAPSPGDWGFGILVRSTQTLLDGNVGKETQFYDRDGSGVTVQPKSKGTSVKFRGIFINGKQVGEDSDGEAESLTEEYSPNFVCFWSYGASTIRCESMQLRQGENALRLQHAPNRQGANRDGDETGKQMCAGNFFFNISAEANKRTYDISGYEKLYMILCQANGVSTNGWDIGDNPDGTYPGVPAGNSPTDLYGGAGLFLLCNALTCKREGFVIWSGRNRIVEPMVAGYSTAREGDIDPGSGVSFTATTTSSRYAFNTGSSGTNNMVIQNKGSVTMYFAIGNSSVTATTSSTPVAPGGYTIFSRTTQTHIAVITASSTAAGSAGKNATLLSAGILLKGTSTKGFFLHGGIISANKSLNSNTNQSLIGPGLHLNTGADKFFVDGTYIMDGGVDLDATAATEAQVRNLGGRAGGFNFSTYPQATVSTVTAATRTLAMTDNGNVISLDRSGGGTLTVPPNSSVAFPLGATIKVVNVNASANTWTIAAGSGVTVVANNLTVTSGQGGELTKVATNTWVFVK